MPPDRGGLWVGNAGSEALHGAPALEGLDGRAHSVDPSTTPYLRALIDDIADALGLPSPRSPGHPAPLTSPSRSQRAAEPDPAQPLTPRPAGRPRWSHARAP